jgi:nicotinamide mononucleotide transporter
MSSWLSENYIEIFGAITGIIYVVLEIRQNIWLWPLGIVTSAVYVYIFFTSKLYADMSLQTYYVIISVLGWWWWIRGAGRRAQGARLNDVSRSEGGDVKKLIISENGLLVTRISSRLSTILSFVFICLYAGMFLILFRLTDSPVPGWDAFLTSLSIVATWMLARKIYEHWYLWIIVNIVSVVLYFTRGLYPTVILYVVYAVMSFIGLKVWKRAFKAEPSGNI